MQGDREGGGQTSQLSQGRLTLALLEARNASLIQPATRGQFLLAEAASIAGRQEMSAELAKTGSAFGSSFGRRFRCSFMTAYHII